MELHFGSNVPAVFPPRFLSIPNLLAGRAVQVRNPWLSVSSKEQLNHQCVMHIILILSAKHSTVPATTKKTDSVPGENRAILSKVNPVLTNSGCSYILTSCCPFTQSLFTLSVSCGGAWLFCISFFHQHFSCFYNICSENPSLSFPLFFFCFMQDFAHLAFSQFLPVSHSS